MAAFPVAKLQAMKAEHERRFAHPDRAMLAKITDWTDADIPTLPASLMGLSRVCGWNLTPVELEEPVEEFADYIARFRNAPIETRRLVVAIARRAHKMKSQQASKISHGQVRLLIDDARSALSLDDQTLSRGIVAIGSYGLGDLDEIDTHDFGPQQAVRLASIGEGIGWDDIVTFCIAEDVDLSAFSDELQFGRLDD